MNVGKINTAFGFFLCDILKLLFRHFKTEVKQKHGRNEAVSKGKGNKNRDGHSTLLLGP